MPDLSIAVQIQLMNRQVAFCLFEMTLGHFLFCLIFTFCQVAGQSPIYALKGREVNFKPNITGRHDAIVWRHNGKIVVEFDGQMEEVNSRYKNRIILDWHTAELDIKDLRFEDSGDYELRRYTEVVQHFHYKLEVLVVPENCERREVKTGMTLEKKCSVAQHNTINTTFITYTPFKVSMIEYHVAKPTISCEMNDDGGLKKSGTLICSAEPRQPQSLMRFDWRSHGKVQPGTNLTISLGDEYDDEVYSCRVSNPLSKETARFTAKDCYPENKSVLIGVPVTMAIVVSLSLLLMGLGVFCCKQHNKELEKNTAEDDENMSLLETTPKPPTPQPPVHGDTDTVKDLEKDEDGKSPPTNLVTPVRKLRSQFTQTTSNMDPEVTAAGQKEDANSDQVTRETDTSGLGGTHESDSSGEDEQLSPVSEQRDLETALDVQHPNLTQGEIYTSEDNQQERDKPDPAAAKESGSEGNSEEADLDSACDQLQSSRPTQPDNRSNDTFKESLDAAHEEPDQQGEGRTMKESEESGESEDDTDEDKKLCLE